MHPHDNTVLCFQLLHPTTTHRGYACAEQGHATLGLSTHRLLIVS